MTGCKKRIPDVLFIKVRHPAHLAAFIYEHHRFVIQRITRNY